MALSNLNGWNTNKDVKATAACGTACGAGKPEETPATSCGAGKPEEEPASACGASK